MHAAGPDPGTVLRAAIAADGPVPFAAFMHSALYGPGGFYVTSPDRAGRAGADFVTSPEMSPAFGTCVARWLVAELPDGGVVADCGGASGTLAAQVRDAWPELSVAPLAVRVVDVNPTVGADAATMAELDLPPQVLIANELLDNLPADLAEADGTPVSVGLDADGGFVCVGPDGSTEVDPVAVVPVGAAAFFDAATALASLRTMLFVDYGTDSAELASRPEVPIRAYRGHERVDPLDAPGSADVTCEVPVDVVAAMLDARDWDVDVSTQAEFLARWGLDDDLAGLRAAELAAAQRGDPIGQLQTRSRRERAAALADPDGLGGFVVICARRR